MEDFSKFFPLYYKDNDGEFKEFTINEMKEILFEDERDFDSMIDNILVSIPSISIDNFAKDTVDCMMQLGNLKPYTVIRQDKDIYNQWELELVKLNSSIFNAIPVKYYIQVRINSLKENNGFITLAQGDSTMDLYGQYMVTLKALQMGKVHMFKDIISNKIYEVSFKEREDSDNDGDNI